jgi:anti-sigma B factor antagonist
MMSYAVEKIGAVHLITLPGEIRLGAEGELTSAVVTALDEGAKGIVLDLGPTKFMDSAGLGALVTSRARVIERGSTLTLWRPNPRVLDLLTLTRVNLVFGIYDSKHDALAAASGASHH